MTTNPRRTVSTTLNETEIALVMQWTEEGEKFGTTLRRLVLRGVMSYLAEQARTLIATPVIPANGGGACEPSES